MSQVKVHASSTASWHELVLEAQNASHITLSEDLQSYLVFLLMRLTEDAELSAKPIALDYLESLNQFGRHQTDGLRTVGDRCLILSGFFPGLAQKRLVRVSYFVHMGQNAYHVLSGLSETAWSTVYRDLSSSFVMLMDVLHTMRRFSVTEPLLQPLEAVELLLDTKSGSAASDVSPVTSGFIVRGNEDFH